jgi:HK97 family phage major capsid protein
MKKELKDLFDKKGKIVNEMQDAYRDVNKRGGVATPEERTKFEGWDKELTEIQEQVDFHQRAAKLDLAKESAVAVEIESQGNKEKKFNDKATSAEKREAVAKAKKSGYTSLSDEERSIVDTDIRDMKAFEKKLRGRELNEEETRIVNSYRAEKRLGTGQSVGTTTAGGYTVPEGFQARIIEYMALVSELLNYASILRTENGAPIVMSINDDTSNTGELIGELSDLSTSSADLVFSAYTLSAYKMSSKMIAVSSELIADNGVNFLDYLAKKLAIRVGKVSNTYYTTGTGSSQPKGFLQTRGKVTSSTSTFTQAELVDLQDSIDPAYRSSSSIAWSMHSNILSEIKQLALASDKPGAVWAPSYRDGEPDRILGKPYFFNQAMSSTSATGDKIVAYGDWSKFIVRLVNDFTLKVSDQRYFELDKVAYVGIQRTDSFLENTAAVKYMDIS